MTTSNMLLRQRIPVWCLLVITFLALLDSTLAWVSNVPTFNRPSRFPGTLRATSPESQQDKSSSKTAVLEEEPAIDDEDEPAGIVGAQFFGGNKQKAELYDPVAEAQAGKDLMEQDRKFYNRFEDSTAFTSNMAASLAQSLQSQINHVLYPNTPDPDYTFKYNDNLQWTTTPLQVKANNPLLELEQARDFYRRLDLAITSARELSTKASTSTIELTWDLSLAWPTFWEPRVLLTGKSVLTVIHNVNGSNGENSYKPNGAIFIIVAQVDTLDTNDLTSSIVKQIWPRFWDIYHIGMTPSAELAPRFRLEGLRNYQLVSLPPRLVLQATQVEIGTRDDRNADMIPQHAFSCVIKTMGPTKQRFVPASPVQVELIPITTTTNSYDNSNGSNSNGESIATVQQQQQQNSLQLKWTIPLAVEFLTQSQLLLPSTDDETDMDAQPSSCYQWQQKRLVATMPYGGSAQDSEISSIRKKLYDSVLRDGHQPKMQNGRPIFFFWQNTVKACYTNEGLGMAVYEFRPKFVHANEVGIELEIPLK